MNYVVVLWDKSFAGAFKETLLTQDVVSKDMVSTGTLTKDTVHHVATREVAQVTQGMSGGFAKIRADVGTFRCRALTCCSRFHLCVGYLTPKAVVFFGMCLLPVSTIHFKLWILLKQTVKQTLIDGQGP